jgi:acyl-CoA thioesterase-2
MVTLHPVTDLVSLLDLEAVKPDAFLGASPRIGWQRLYGGQVVAQALMAACRTIDSGQLPHSLHAYFVRAGDEGQPVLYEVDRVRDGRSFSTRQVVAYQEGGAILNLIASFHAPEPGADVQSVTMPSCEGPDAGERWPTDLFFDHRVLGRWRDPQAGARGWMRTLAALGDDPILHACAFAYLSDEDALGAALTPHPLSMSWEHMMAASLDHAIWFHRPLRADDWLLFDLTGYGVADSRGLATVQVYDQSGVHVASVAQEALGRERRG